MRGQWIPTIGGLVVLLLLWQAIVWWSDLPPILLPGPVQVATTMWQERAALGVGVAATCAASALGLLLSLLVGSIVALLLSQSRWLRAAIFPYVLFLQTVPIVAIAPLLTTWFGYRFRTVVLVASIISLFPIVSNVTSGLISIDPLLLDVFRVHRASRWQIMVKLRIPHAIRYLVLGLRVSTGLAIIGAIVGELFVGDAVNRFAGLGTLISAWQRMARTDAVMGAIVASTLLGISLLSIVNLLCDNLLARWSTAQEFESQR
ncbi:MAG: ABC transporter permease [Pirellulaceae bacterium]|nr:MAG: ABC transporter permease [Pirellulaceae bacterium]